MKKITLLILFMLIEGSLIYGQGIDNIVPPSPEAAKMASYTFTPTNLYRGTTNLSVPLHTINFYGMSLPISMSYNSGGIRANEDAGLIGLGWSLQHTGVISRVIMGRDDLYKNSGDANAPSNLNLADGYVFNTTAVPEVPVDFTSTEYRDFFWSTEANAVKAGSADTQPDIFSLSLFGNTTKFILGKISGGEVDVIKLTEDTNKIEFDKDNFTFTVTTAQGFVAVFDKKARSTIVTGADAGANKWEASRTSKVDFVNGIYNAGKFRRISSWYLSTITSPTGRSITFNYDIVGSDRSDYVSVSAASFGEKYSFASSGTSGGVNYNTGAPDSPVYEPTSCTRIIHEHFYPTSIVSTDLQLNISFNKTYRDDLRKPNLAAATGSVPHYSEYYITSVNAAHYNSVTFLQPQRITGIDISSTVNSLGDSPKFTKDIDFTQTYFNPGSTGDDRYRFKRLKLDQVTINDQVWKFEYNAGLPDKSTNGKDYWGFYNGEHADQDLLPAYINPITSANDWTDVSFFYQQDNRKADYNHAIAGLLTKVIYPTGGETRYEYESNSYRIAEGEYSTEGIAPNYVAGAFIADSETPVFTFENSVGDTCSYPGSMKINLRFNSYSGDYNGPVLTADLNDYAVELVNANTNTVVSSWATWREIEESPTGDHYYEDIPIYAPGDYKVRVKRKADANGQTMYYATVEVNLPAQCDQTPPTNGTAITNQVAGGLRIKTIKNYDSRQGIVGKKRFTYTTIEDGAEVSSGVLMTPLRNIYLASNASGAGNFAFIFSSPSQLPHANTAMGGFLGYSKVTEVQEKLSSGENNGEVISEFLNRPNDVINAMVVNGYEETNGKLSNKKILNTSDLQVKKTQYTYDVKTTNSTRALKYNIYNHSLFGAVIQWSTNYYLKSQFVAPKNIVTTEQLGTEELVSNQFTIYNNNFLVESKQTTNSSGEILQTEYRYPQDYTSPHTTIQGMIDKNLIATPIEVVKKRGLTTVGASASVFKPGAGTYLPYQNLTWNEDLGGHVASSDGSSFDSSFESFGEILAFDNHGNPQEFISEAGVYTAILWGYNGNYPVAMITNATYAQASGALNLSVLNSPTSNAALRTELNKLRTDSNLQLSQVTTMTYQPMVGMDSQTSPDGLIQYYEYDAYGRLLYVKDHQNNILKRLEYEYQHAISNTSK